MNEQVKNAIANGAIIIVISLLLLFASTWWRMHNQFRHGETSLRNGDFTGAIAGFESALHMYIPYQPTIEKAAEKLWQIGEANERLGDITRALIAYRSLRSSFYADRWLVTPGKSWIKKCDKKIAALIPLQHER